jgi:hypothetical protein
MAKRKRDDETSKPTGLVGAKGARIQYKVETSTAKVRHAFKVARGFERPKMDKRRRAAAAADTKTVDDIERIESERSALQVSSVLLDISAVIDVVFLSRHWILTSVRSTTLPRRCARTNQLPITPTYQQASKIPAIPRRMQRA